MQTTIKKEFPALLEGGFHERTLSQVLEEFVMAFPDSTSRPQLMEALTVVVHCLQDEQIEGHIWLDGSFLTAKVDPEDIDFILVAASSIYDEGTERQREIMDSLIDGDYWDVPLNCDTNVLFVLPEDVGDSTNPVKYWTDRFGLTMLEHAPKGIVKISLGRSEDDDDVSG